MTLLDVRTLERALQYYLDGVHFDVLYLVVSSDAQCHKVVACSDTQDTNTPEGDLFLALSPLSEVTGSIIQIS